MSKPILLLDMDGTVNVGGQDPPVGAWDGDKWLLAQAYSTDGYLFNLRAAEEVVNFFTLVHGLGLADIRWHSHWLAASTAAGKALGFPEFPVQEPFPFGCPVWRSPAWKLNAVNFHVAEGRDVIWVDDEAERLWGYQIDWNVTPTRELGLTKEELRQIASLIGLKGVI